VIRKGNEKNHLLAGTFFQYGTCMYRWRYPEGNQYNPINYVISTTKSGILFKMNYYLFDFLYTSYKYSWSIA